MSPRKRNAENRGLPARWQHTHGAYFYQVPPGLEHLWNGKKKFRLGTTLSEAYKVWTERVAAPERVQTIGHLLDQYLLEVVPEKKRRTQVGNKRQVVPLRKVFGNMPIADIKPTDIYKYIKLRGAKTAGMREVEVLSHAYTKAVEWGYIDQHPFLRQVRIEGAKKAKRTRYVEDWEIVEALALRPMRKAGSVLMIQSYIRIKLLTGMRRSDLLQLRPGRDFSDDGIRVTPTKTEDTTGKSLIFSWTPALTAAVEAAKSARPIDIAPWLFCNGEGQCYINEDGLAPGFESMWGRFMARLLKETKLTDRFTERSLRSKAASDAESTERAQKLLGHADAEITERVYRLKPETVRPLR